MTSSLFRLSCTLWHQLWKHTNGVAKTLRKKGCEELRTTPLVSQPARRRRRFNKLRQRTIHQPGGSCRHEQESMTDVYGLTQMGLQDYKKQRGWGCAPLVSHALFLPAQADHNCDGTRHSRCCASAADRGAMKTTRTRIPHERVHHAYMRTAHGPPIT
jgi:hypothetical protein